MIDDLPPHPFLSLGDHLYDVEKELLEDAHGQLINLRPQSAQVLNILARNLGDIITKDALLDAVWPNVSVTEDSLVQCISDIRRAIADKDRTLVRTVPKRGYMLVAPAPDARLQSPSALQAASGQSLSTLEQEFGLMNHQGARLYIRLSETESAPHDRQIKLVDYGLEVSQFLRSLLSGKDDGHVSSSFVGGTLLEFTQHKNAIKTALELNKWCVQRNMDTANDRAITLGIGVDVGLQSDPEADRIRHLATLAGPCEIVVSADMMNSVTAGLDCEFLDMGDCALPEVNQSVRCFKALQRNARAIMRPILNPEDLLPTIAVIPFMSKTSDPETKVVGEVLADDVISLLSRSLQINVISRMSTTSFRHRDATLSEIGNALDANYVLTGRYLYSNNRIKIDVELSEVATGRVIWVDQATHDVSHVLDAPETIEWIVFNVQRAIYAGVVSQARQEHLPSLHTYTLLMSAVALMHRLSPTDFNRARVLLEALIDRAPDQAVPLAWMSRWHVLRVQQGWSEDPTAEAMIAMECTKRALDLDPDCVLALVSEGLVMTNLLRKLDDAEARYDRALDLSPNDAVGRLLRGTMYAFRGQGTEAMRDTERSLHLTPLDPLRFFFLSLAASACISAENYDRALEFSNLSLRANSTHTSTLRVKAVAQMRLGHGDAARETGRKLLSLQPNLRVSEWLKNAPSSAYANGREFGNTLREIGIPN
ncbi:MAG: adenylate cyclase [Ascidiaceihabitans sp.]|jgi:adenylate cyclase